MANEVKLNIDVDGAARTIAQFRAVEKSIDRLDGRTKGLSSRLATMGNALGGQAGAVVGITKLKRSMDMFDKVIQKVGGMGLKALGMSLKFATLEMAAMGAAMVAVHGAFILGNAAMKAMRATLGPLAAGMTAVVAAAAAASAAIREQQAAMYAYKTTNKTEFGSSMNQTRQVMRALHTDTYLASAGVENLNKAFGTISKNSTFTMKSQNLLKGLMDFASAGQPIEEGIQKAADLIALLQDSKKSFSEAKTSAQQLFPGKEALDKALKDLKITTKKGLEKAITSGELAKAAGLEGQFEAVSGTLINRLKGYFNLIKQQFADIGQPLLEPVKQAANDIFNILRRGFVKISGNTQKFGMGSMLESLVSMVDKLTTWSTNLINSNIKSVDGMFSKMARWWKEFKYGWNETLDKLRPFIDGARVIEQMFGAVWKHVKNIVSSSFGQFNEWLQANRSTVIEFGDRIGELIGSIMKFQSEMKKLLQDLMPFINDVVNGISAMVDQLTGFIKGMRALTGGGTIGALATLMGIRAGFGAMKNTKGGFIPDTKNMTVNAGSVTLHSPATPGTPSRAGGGGMTGGGGLGTTGAYYASGGAGATGMPSRGGLASRSGMATTTGGGPRFPGFVLPTGAAGPSSPLPPGHPALAPSALPPPPPGAVPVPGAPPPPGTTPRGPGRFSRGMSLFGAVERRYFQNTGLTDEERAFNRMYERTGTYSIATRQEIIKNKAGFRAAMARRSMANRQGRMNSTAGRALNRFQGSQGARMGTGLALGAMSQFAPEEAQGALALGGAISTINPLAGIGVAGLGTAMKSRTATGGAVSGLAGGAAMGAMIGTFVGPIGTAAGAVIGGLIGAVSGGIMGTLNKKKEEVKKSKAAATAAANSIVNNALSFTLDAVRLETGVGRSATRDALAGSMKYQRNLLGDIKGTPLNRKNFYGIVPDVLNRGATGGQAGLALESATGKRMPKQLRNLLGTVTMPVDFLANFSAGLLSKLGGKSLLDNRILNPLGYGTNNKKDVDRQKQEATITKIYRNQKSYGTTISEQEYEDMMKKPGEALRKLQEEADAKLEASKPLQENYNKRLDMLNKITGKSDQEVIALAKSMGVNLYDSTKNFNEVLKELGLTVVATAEQMKAATTSAVTNAMSIFDQSIKARETVHIIDEVARTIRDKKDAGTLTEIDKITGMRDIMSNLITGYGEGGRGLLQFIQGFEGGGGKPADFFGPTGPFRGMDPTEFTGGAEYKAFKDKALTDTGMYLGAELNKKLASSGQAIDIDQFTKQFKGMTPQQMLNVVKFAESGFTTTATTGEDARFARMNPLGALGMDLDITKLTKAQTETENLPQAIGDATMELITQMEIFFKETDKATPSWYTTAPSWWANHSDTSTPRGRAFGDTSTRLSQTMGRHAAMDGMLTGKRTVTSSFRTYGLGSINSDHVTGRAYDLVGQNLGQYQGLVRSTGGFAEFHGVNGARHLHVVPGAGPMGDNRVPVAKTSQQPIVMGSSSTGREYNFYISGNENASAKEIAEMVMRKIKETERSNKERM